MKKKIISSILIVFCLLLTGCNNNAHGSKELELTYKSNGGVPYEWKYEIEDPSIVEFVKSYVIEDKNKEGMTGAPISTNYVFKGLKEGTTVVTFKYVSIVDGSIDKEEKNTIKVDKYKNISLQGNNN